MQAADLFQPYVRNAHLTAGRQRATLRSSIDCGGGGSSVSRRDAPAKAVSRLSHEQAADLLVDYHFGRLSPKMNAAVEAHVRTCRICQRQGLEHAATERREVLRVRVKPTRPLVSRRSRVIFVLLLLALGFQLTIFEVVRSDSPFAALLHHGAAAPSPTPSVTPTATVAAVRKVLAFDSSTNAAVLTLSPDGKSLAGGPVSGSAPTIGLWDASTGVQTATLAWPGDAAPGVLAWSPDGTQLAASDGSFVGVWDVSSKTMRWRVILPSTPAVRVYDATDSGNVVQRPDANGVFAQGMALKWGNNGQVQDAPASALGASGVATVGGPAISLWQASGFHLFKADGNVSVGFSQSDRDQHRALLSWSPDGHYLFWTNVARAVAASGSNAGLPPPDPVVAAIAGQLGANDQDDASVWLTSDGSRLAGCTRTRSGAPLDVYDVAAGRVVATLAGVCDHLSSASLAWSADGATLFIAVPGAPTASYALPAKGS